MSELAPQAPTPNDIRRLQEAHGLYVVPEAAKANAALTEHHVDNLELVSDVIPVSGTHAKEHRRATREAGPPRHIEVETVENDNVVHLPVRRHQPEEITAEDRRKAAQVASGRTHRRATSPAGPSPYAADNKGVTKSDRTDFASIDAKGRGHRHDGKFLSRHEAALIVDHADQIQAGLADRHAERVIPDSSPNAHTIDLTTVEADSAMPSIALSEEQEAQLEQAIQTGDRLLLPVELTDAEWEAATGLKTESADPDTPASAEPDTGSVPKTAEHQPKHRDELSTLMPMKPKDMFIWDGFSGAQRRNWLKAEKAPRGYSKNLWADLSPVERARVLDARIRHGGRVAKVLSAIGLEHQFERDEDGSIRREIKLGRRRLAASALIGVLAITGIAANVKGSAQHRENAHTHSSTMQDLPDKSQIKLPIPEQARHRAAANTGSVTFTVGGHGNIWDNLEKYASKHGASPDVRALDKAKDAILKYNHISEPGARKMSVTQRYDVPQQVLDELLRSK